MKSSSLFLMMPAMAAAASFCGNATAALDPTRKNVLLIGDSISMLVPYTPGGYGVNVIDLLAAVNVSTQHAGGSYSGGQCSNTVKGLNCTAPGSGGWLAAPSGLPWDVITFNFGLHDLVNCNNTGECSEHVDIPTYAANLVTIYSRLQAVARRVIWVTTTPVPNIPNMNLGRNYTAPIEYNAAALSALQAAVGPGLLVVDLWSAVVAYCGQLYTSCPLQRPNDVHYTPEGQAFLGNLVAQAILQAMAS